ncbi:ChrR Cupin-like domain-containing protein [Geodermatophilus africanus]|jgi:anti-sigma factor ChrR (cupin superfamily)|uniref:ChrR Cupin-like domain-containing protein n=1 Tax=Geodermatophilus africanus TaxID=1137993 RepID=A0A1H3AM86_9ACTN|nr:cupin domain-containing protein [Geodermatophilus africanus]SDX29949.1 ChrR Cupin-like domain-containing protein [Geodermatophilus africanus]
MSDLFFPDVFRNGFAMTDLPWVPWVEPGRAGVEHCVLWAPAADEPSVALLLRFPPGAHGDFHEHLGHELMLVLDGRLDHSDGRSFRRGDLVVEAPGSRHQMSSAEGCTVLAIRTKPAQPRQPLDGEVVVGVGSAAAAD